MSLQRLTCALALSAAAAACNTTSSSSDPPLPSASAISSSAGTLTAPAIVWPSPASIDSRALEALGDARSRVARSPLPVLAPSADLGLDAPPTVIVEQAFYAITARVSGATIAIHGTATAHRHEGVAAHPGDRRLRTGSGFVTVNEGIRSASFVENGAAYSVDVECASAGDRRCQTDAFVVGIVERLAYVGGAAR